MKITKFEHSCLEITDGNGRLVVDPGIFTKSFKDFSNIQCLVITHIHPDHFDPEKVQAIIAASPDVQIFTTKETAEKIQHNKVTVPEHQKTYKVGSFALEFFGEQHGIVVPNMVFQNIGVLVNQKLYYPGDSLTTCEASFEVLAIPTEAPWLTTGELPAFLEKLNCKQVFPAHDGLLNTDGHELYNMWLGKFAAATDKKFIGLKPGQSIEV